MQIDLSKVGSAFNICQPFSEDAELAHIKKGENFNKIYISCAVIPK